MDDFNIKAQEISTLGKGGKYRTVTFNDKVKSALQAWLKDRGK
jgi:site-specific recombinase XerC